MYCNGLCNICRNYCTHGEINNDKNMVETPVVKKNLTTETGLVVQDAGTFEVVKTIFGKEKVRKLK